MAIDNWHTVIVLCLLAFGIGHAVFRARIGFWTFLLLIVFVSPLLLVYQEEKYYTLVLISLVVGFAYAHRQVVMDIVDDVLDGLRWFTGLFKRRPKQNTHQSHQNTSNHYQQNQQQWQAEQARREQEAREQREREKQQKEQQGREQASEQPHYQQQSQHNSQNQNQGQRHSQRQSDTGAGGRSRYSTSKEVDNAETDSRSPMDILGLQSSFTPQELKAAYKRESARCHPDRWAKKPKAIRKMMEQEMKLVNWAYQQLK